MSAGLSTLACLSANLILFAGSFWALFSRKVPTGVGGSAALCLLCLAALGNLAGRPACRGWGQLWLDGSAALCLLWVFWQIEIRPRLGGRRAAPGRGKA